jgi:micrococcal nuclease
MPSRSPRSVAVPMRRFLIVVAVLLAAFLAGGGALRLGASERDEGRARVLRVVDGDTILVRIPGPPARRERVRYIGIDAPESVTPERPVECYGPASAAANRRLVGGRTVTLSTDAERRDRFGRLLAYVRVDGRFVNAELVRGGFATALEIAPNLRHAARLRALEREARRAGRGLWGACRSRR